MDLYFDNKKIDNKYIYKLGKSSILFDKQFYLGATLCTQVELQIDKRAISSQPNYIYFKDGTTKLLTLIVDSVDDTNLFYYDYILTDCMILFNREFDLSTINSNTVQGKLNALCSTILGTTAPTINYIGDMVLDWNENSTPRKLISFIGEVNGCYAYIDGDNKLVFANQCYQAVKKTIQVEDCSDFALGEKIKFDRVVYDYGTATYKWPTDDNYTDVGNQTYYVQDDNFLLTDSGNYTIGNIVKRIYDNIHDFEFYNIEVSKCLFDSTTKAGELISFANGTNNYITIAQYEWTYNGS